VIDTDGFRPNVGIIICNKKQQLFWARRIGQNSWQFPQGGIDTEESPEQAMYRELEEEVGLKPEHVKQLGRTKDWLRYRLPKKYIRKNTHPVCIGQKQIWFLLEVDCDESDVCLDKYGKPEFDSWRWVDYWYPLKEVVYFKHKVYEKALRELAPLILDDPRQPGRKQSNYLRSQRR